jgi:2,6-dihydroxypseudooxynicotine hydrolase
VTAPADTSSPVPVADQLIVRETHARLNHLWAIHGVQALAVLGGPIHSRTQLLGMDNSEVDRIIVGIRSFITGLPTDWIGSWTRAGDEYDERATEFLDRGRTRSAASMGLIAAMCHHVGEMMVFGLGRLPRREDAAARCVASYRRVAEYCDPPAMRLDIPFGTTTIPAYLRVPVGLDRPACVLVAGGANSVKEENHGIADFFLARGLATLTFDGPGQGEYVLTSGTHLRADRFDAAVTTIVDWLCASDLVDPERLAFFGKATSGLLGVHAAASEHRLKAIVAHPGTYDWGTFFELQLPFYPSQFEMFTLLGATSLEAGTKLVKRELTLEGVLPDVRAPMLIVNAVDDYAIPVTEAERIKDNATADVEVVIFQGRAHGGPSAVAHALEGDWLAERLA